MNISPIVAAPDSSTPALTAAPGRVEVASPFDSILALESLAATPPAVDVSCMEDLLVQEDGESDDDTDGEIEDLLAFLSSLMNSSAPLPASPTQNAGAAEDSAADALAGMAGGAAGKGDASELAPLIAGKSDEAQPGESGDKSSLAQGFAGALLDSAAEAEGAKGVDAATSVRSSEWLQPAARHAAAVEGNRIATPARDPRWAEEFGTRVALMVRGGESSAALQLTPVDLGPVEVSVTVRDSQASIHFGAAQAETRALLEASIPRLREMLAAQGFNLMDASVSQGFSREAQQGSQLAAQSGSDGDSEQPAVRQVHSLGLLDLYA